VSPLLRKRVTRQGLEVTSLNATEDLSVVRLLEPPGKGKVPQLTSMPRTTSVHLAANGFLAESRQIKQLVSQSQAIAQQLGVGRSFQTSFYDYGIIRLHAAFEGFILKALVGVINQRPSVLTQKTDVSFPRNMSKSACEFLVTGGRNFDVRGREGLIRVLKHLLPDNFYLVEVVADLRYRQALDRLWALRNFAVHRSAYSKMAALQAVRARNMSSAGAWLSKYARLSDTAAALEELVTAVKARAHH
jgi:hypothetical protein